MEVSGNTTLAGANPIFFTSADRRFAASAERATARMGDLGSGLAGMGHTICEIAISSKLIVNFRAVWLDFLIAGAKTGEWRANNKAAAAIWGQADNHPVKNELPYNAGIEWRH